MVPFLKQVAERYYRECDVSGMCFVFPNRRSMAFFRKYLSEAVEGKPLISPEMYTVNDFFFRLSGTCSADRVTLLIELYESYRKLNPKAESLDEFIFWGDIILGDFNDIDKYLVDPSRLYANVSDFKAMQDTFGYLTPSQREAIEGFVSHFNDRSGKLTVDLGSDNPNVKERFLLIWNILYPLYTDFRERLRSKGISYEGMVYRGIADRLKEESVADILSDTFHKGMRYVFVGLNALNECEKALMRKMRDASLADFCWDYSGEMIRDRKNRSSFFMGDNVKEFPQRFTWDEDGVKVPSFKIISVPSSVGQVKQVPGILRSIADRKSGGDISCVGRLDGESLSSGTDCALVLPDENLLMPLLNTIPPEIGSVNVTMGYPMTGSGFYSMMSEISSLQLHARLRPDGWAFYYRQVWSLFSNSVFKKAMGEEGAEVAAAIKSGTKLYVPQSDFGGSDLFRTVFRPVFTDQKSTSGRQIEAMVRYQMEVIGMIAPLLADDPDMAVEMEFAKEYYRCVNRLGQMSLEVLPMTYIRILEQLLRAVSVPFKGEPLKGLQIMGPLETRALDFTNIVLLSANEGIFPRRSVSSSFIPPELRKGFGLPTYEYQDAVWAYYFYRMITRAENVWILYDSRTEGMKTGEESRYIKQLEYHFRLPLERFAADARSRTVNAESEIIKTPEDVAFLKTIELSASSIQNYMACPAQFYYSSVKGLAPEEEVSESMDAAMIGNVYHGVMRALYCGEGLRPLARIERSYIEGWLGRQKDIKDKVRECMMAELKDTEISGRNLVIEDVIVKYVCKTLERDLEQMRDKGTDSFKVEGLELKLKAEACGFRFKGFVDRIDSFADDEIRIVDYKTGKVLPEDLAITDEQAEATVGKLFGPDRYFTKPKIAFQLFVYDMLLKESGRSRGRRIINSVYSTARLFSEAPQSVAMGEGFYKDMYRGLEQLLAEIENTAVPFRRTDDADVCTYCNFKVICGR